MLKTEEELDEDTRRAMRGEEPAPESANEVAMPPDGFKTWVEGNLKRIAKAQSTPYFIADNCKGRINEYARYKTDENYHDVAFNYANGGLKAIHHLHNFDKRKGWYEQEVQEVGFKSGHKVIFELEDHTKRGVRNTEGTWDDMKFEVAAAETATPNNIRNALKHCASKPGCKVAVIFFPNGSIPSTIRDGLAKYNGLRKTPQWEPFKSIYFIGRDGTIKHLPPLS